MSAQFVRQRLPLVSLLVLVFLAACGGDPLPHSPHDAGWDVVEETDAAPELDADGDVGRAPDATPDVALGPDDAGEDTFVDPSLPTLSDFITCSSDLDCPINGSSCLRYVRLNRQDSTGREELAMSEVFDGLADGEGICSRGCSTDPTTCSTVRWPDDRGQSAPSRCVVVATGATPYVLESQEPFAATVDLADAELGTPFAALCMPPFEFGDDRPADFCRSCDAPSACGDESTCFNMLTGAPLQSAAEIGQAFCLQSCDTDDTCPLGFSCLLASGDEDETHRYCVPDGGTCTACIDHDQDGFGAGHCGPASKRQTPHDCDDGNPHAFYDPANMAHPFPAHCGSFDYNCDGIRDDLQQVGTELYGSDHCTSCYDACSGEVEGGVRLCDVQSHQEPLCIAGCAPGLASCGQDPSLGCTISVEDPDYLYLQDADGDGFGDGAMGPVFFCTPAEAAAALINVIAYHDHPKNDDGALLLDCDDSSNTTYPGAPELCNGVDNSCNAIANDVDPAVVGVGASCTVDGLQGLCAIGAQICEQRQGTWRLSCVQTVFPTPEICDGLDNSCSGVVDDVAAIGNDCTVPNRQGECAKGQLACNPTATGVETSLSCEQVNFPRLEEPGFDGIDHSCDGFDRYGKNGDYHAIFVRAQGSVTLADAVEQANTCILDVAGQNVKCDVFVQASYNHASPIIQLRNGVDIYGGFATDVWPPTTFVAPDYSGSNPLSEVIVAGSSTGNTVGANGVNITTPTHIYGLSIRTGDSTAPSGANTAFRCANCTGLRLRQVATRAGAGGPGNDGTTGNNGAHAPAPRTTGGAQGTAFISDYDYDRLPGGTGAHHGGASGRVSSRNGRAGQGPRGGAGGTSSARTGTDGGGGIAIPPQDPPQSDFGTLNWNGSFLAFTPTTSPVGTAGGDAHGSGAGGAYASRDTSFGGHIHNIYMSSGGGGHSGAGGTGGRTGGPSIGFALINTSGGISLNNVQFNGGAGGKGGDGGNGGRGGRGGDGVTVEFFSNQGVVTYRSAGGGYGAGGTGGTGGNGGPSIGLFLMNSFVSATQETYSAGTGGMGGNGGNGGTRGDEGIDGVSERRQALNGSQGANGLQGFTCRVYNTSLTSTTIRPADCTITH